MGNLCAGWEAARLMVQGGGLPQPNSTDPTANNQKRAGIAAVQSPCRAYLSSSSTAACFLPHRCPRECRSSLQPGM